MTLDMFMNLKHGSSVLGGSDGVNTDSECGYNVFKGARSL